MLTEDLRRQLSALRRGQPATLGRDAERRGRTRKLQEWFPEGRECETPRGEVFACHVGLESVFGDAARLTEAYCGAFRRARSLAEEGALLRHLGPLAGAEVEGTALIDTETAGWQGRPSGSTSPT